MNLIELHYLLNTYDFSCSTLGSLDRFGMSLSWGVVQY